MKIKEFTQKNSSAIFVIAIILLIVTIVLGFEVCNLKDKSFDSRKMRGNGDMMQNNFRQNRNFNPNQMQPQETNDQIPTQNSDTTNGQEIPATNPAQ